MSWAGKLRGRGLAREIARRAEVDARAADRSDWIAAWQLERFNELWREISVDRTHFAQIRRERSLPETFESWDQIRASLPTMGKATLQTQRGALESASRPPELTTATGGSTGRPVQIGKWNTESQIAAGDVWHARSWFGVEPDDRLFLLWGHSHLLGTGLSGFAQRVARGVKDRALGYRRHSAYDLSRQSLEAAGDALLAHRPQWVLGYSAALDRFARVNQARADEFARLGLEVAVATGESFPNPEARGRLAEVLGCRVAMEYGTVETGLLAHEHPEAGWRVLWQHWFVEVDPESQEAIVTALYPRATPLIRYRVGDRLAVRADRPPLLELEAVLGRTNETLELDDGTPVHSEAFSHAVREEAVIEAFQVRGGRDGKIALGYVGPRDLESEEIERVRQRLAKIHPRLAGVTLTRLESLEQTLAGKTLTVVREDRDDPAEAIEGKQR